MQKILLSALFVVLTLVPAAQSQDDPVLVRIGSTQKITLSDFKRFLSYGTGEGIKAIENNPQQGAAALKRIVTAKVVANIARKQGFDQRLEIREQLDLIADNFLFWEYLNQEVGEKIGISEEEAERYYHEHQDKFVIPEMVRVRHILFRADKTASDEQKKNAQVKANDIVRRIRGGEDFSLLAGRFSEDSVSRDKAGDLGFIPRGKMGGQFDTVAFSLKLGAVSDPVETDYGFHILKVEDKQKASLEPYATVREKIIRDLKNEKRLKAIDDFIRKTLLDAGVEIDTAPLSKVLSTTP